MSDCYDSLFFYGQQKCHNRKSMYIENQITKGELTMKRKLVSVLLAAVMTVSSLSITSAASVDADDFISSEETVVEHEQETDEEQEDQLQTETETPPQANSGIDIGSITAGEDIVTDTPTDNVVETPTEVPHSVKTKAEKADIFFNDDLKKLKNGTLENLGRAFS